MINKETTYKTAFENKKNRLNERLRHREILLNAAYETNPRLKIIDSSLSSLGVSLAMTALSGKREKLKEMEKKSKLLTAEKQDILKRAQVPEIEYECSLCSDTGLVSGKICSCIKKEAANIMLKELSKKMPIRECKFDNFELSYYSDKPDADGNISSQIMVKVYDFCKEYADKFNPEVSESIIFRGNPGLGKTHLTMAIVAEVINKGYLPVYGSAENLFSFVENEKFLGEGKGAYEAMLESDLLVIDDLGTELVTAFTKSILYNIVNTRILSKKPTIINTNLELEEIKEIYGNRIASRFMGEYSWKEFVGKDIRLLKALNK